MLCMYVTWCLCYGMTTMAQGQSSNTTAHMIQRHTCTQEMQRVFVFFSRITMRKCGCWMANRRWFNKTSDFCSPWSQRSQWWEWSNLPLCSQQRSHQRCGTWRTRGQGTFRTSRYRAYIMTSRTGIWLIQYVQSWAQRAAGTVWRKHTK